jgi:hypothetical protein
MDIVDQNVAVAGEQLPAFLKRAPSLQEEVVGMVLSLPVLHLRADPLAGSQDLAARLDPAPQRAPAVDQGLVADLGQALAAALVPAGDQEASGGIAEQAHDLGHRRLVGDGGARAGVLLAFARRHQADEQAARRLLPAGIQTLVDLLGASADRAGNPTDRAVGREG